MADLKIVLTVVDKATGQVRTVRKSLQELEGTVGRTDTRMTMLQRTVAGLSLGKLAGIGVAGVTLGAVAGQIGSAITAASDLNETLSKTGVVFGQAADRVKEIGNDSIKSLGMSRNEALSAAAAFGNLFVSMKLDEQTAASMSTRLVKLASDLASFHNIRPEDALEKLRAGLVGESEPMRQLGVLLNETNVRAKALAMGFREVDGQLSESAKVQARYALILEQTTKAQGDFARTSDGVANSQRILDASVKDLSASLGRTFLPMAAATARALADLAMRIETVITRINDMPGPEKWRIGPGGSSLQQMADGWNSFTRAINDFREARDKLLGQARQADYVMFATRDVRAKEDALRDLTKAYEDWVREGQDAAGTITDAMIRAANDTSRAWRQAERSFAETMSGMERAAAIAAAEAATQAANIRSRMWREMEQAENRAITMARAKVEEVWESIKWGSQELLDIDTRSFNEGLEEAYEKASRLARQTARDAAAAFEGSWRESAQAAGEALTGLKRVWDSLVNAPLRGETAATRRAAALSEQVTAAELRLATLQRARAPRADIRAAEKRLADLQQQARIAELQVQAVYAPQRRRIMEAAEGMPTEYSFGQVLSGLSALRPQLAAAQAVQARYETNNVTVNFSDGAIQIVGTDADEGVGKRIVDEIVRQLAASGLASGPGASAALAGAR